MRKALILFALASIVWGADSRPKVRAITAFINIDPKTYTAEYDNTMKFLDSAREAYRAAGFEVETVRIVTQPYTRYTAGMKRDEALTFISNYNLQPPRCMQHSKMHLFAGVVAISVNHGVDHALAKGDADLVLLVFVETHFPCGSHHQFLGIVHAI